MPRDKAILLISPEPWDAHFVSKHHYAMAVAKRGARVLFLNPPDDSLSSLVMNDVEACPCITVVDGPRVARGLRFYPEALRRRLERRWLERLEALADVEIRTVWLFENSRFFDMGFAGDRLKIYHQVDLNQEFNPKVAAGTADACFCTTDFIRQRLSPYSDQVYKIHHGLAEVEAPLELSGHELQRFDPDRVHAAYIGNLDIAYLDLELLAEIVRRFPEVCFHLVGAYQDGGALRRLLKHKSNVVWWGPIEHEKIPAVLGCVDINLVTYRAEAFREQLASPHKFMEYLASGKVVVCTYTDEYKDKRELLVMADTLDDYLGLLNSVLSNLDLHNAAEKACLRIQFAEQHSYGNQLLKIEHILEEFGLRGVMTPQRSCH